ILSHKSVFGNLVLSHARCPVACPSVHPSDKGCVVKCPSFLAISPSSRAPLRRIVYRESIGGESQRAANTSCDHWGGSGGADAGPATAQCWNRQRRSRATHR